MKSKHLWWEIYTGTQTLAPCPLELFNFCSWHKVCTCRTSTLQTHQLLTILQQLLLPREVSQETKKESEHVLDPCPTWTPGQVRRLKVFPTPLSFLPPQPALPPPRYPEGAARSAPRKQQPSMPAGRGFPKAAPRAEQGPAPRVIVLGEGTAAIRTLRALPRATRQGGQRPPALLRHSAAPATQTRPPRPAELGWLRSQQPRRAPC